MRIVRVLPDDMLELKKPHPCGSKLFRVVRVGSEVRIICSGCGRDLTLDRPRLEKSIKKVITKEEKEKEKEKNV